MQTRKTILFLHSGIVLILLPVLISGQYDPEDIPYDDCGGSDDQMASVRLTGCEEDDICKIKMGDVLTLKVKWKTNQAVIVKLQGKLEVQFFLGFKKEVEVSPIDACQYLKCPLSKNTQIEYVANFTVPTEGILPGEGRIWWKGYEESEDNPLLCLNFLVKIQS
ncbi:mite group 2 allergen Lep d 2-like [Coccinella septempunctata]|uniref:mite group 2 allergen Lep d 2-like n=1 Tax=Coccinella septempunctata TaxID=41139 RepID=UPI001D076EEA|nr:mite group 2 allergen Lep d 2-like [Coccinella septempunctata]